MHHRLKQTVMLCLSGKRAVACILQLHPFGYFCTLCQATNPAPGGYIAVSDAACSKVLHCCSLSRHPAKVFRHVRHEHVSTWQWLQAMHSMPRLWGPASSLTWTPQTGLRSLPTCAGEASACPEERPVRWYHTLPAEVG